MSSSGNSNNVRKINSLDRLYHRTMRELKQDPTKGKDIIRRQLSRAYIAGILDADKITDEE